MQHWNAIASVAMLGTRRTALPDSLRDEAAAGCALPSDSAERTLLRVAAVAYLRQVAGGRAPIIDVPSVENASTVDVPGVGAREDRSRHAASLELPRAGMPSTVEARVVSESAAWRLARMLGGEYRELIPEWFALANSRGATLPRQWLPVVLGALKPAQRNQYRAVLGSNAAWLARQNPAWSFHITAAEPAEERWNNGSFEERRVELAALRAVDPARARQWIESTWKVDPPDAREEFIRTLLIGLSADDEELLERALDDKRKGVRAAAAQCLSHLPQSAHAARNHARLAPLIVLQPKPTGLLASLKKRQLIVSLPPSLDKVDSRDGIELNPPAQQKIGERAFWLEQMIALARPSYWTHRFDCDAQTFIVAALATDHARELLVALSRAAARHEDEQWITALCLAWLDWKSVDEPRDLQSEMLTTLVSAAPPAARESLLQQLLGALDVAHFDLALTLLSAVELPWSVDVTRRAMKLLAQRIAAETQQWSHPVNTLTLWGRRAHLSAAPQALEDLLSRCPDKSPWRNALEALQDIIEFRLAIQQELMT